MYKNCSLDELKTAPWRLKLQAETTTEQLRTLVLKNYHVFIQSNQCTTIVKDDLISLKENTNEILALLPPIQKEYEAFQDHLGNVLQSHHEIQHIMNHYEQIIQVLEIPQVLEACIHAEQYDSALDLLQFLRETFPEVHIALQTSEKKSQSSNINGNVIVQTLANEITILAQLLRSNLLQKLREDVQLVRCVRIVSHLRRLDTYLSSIIQTNMYEMQLKTEFLYCRNIWLNSCMQSITTGNAYQYLIQLIEAKRTTWFDMITQYSAIFGADYSTGKVDLPLAQWATTNIMQFIATLHTYVPQIGDFSSLATVIEQSIFFGGTLGRVGVDFRAILSTYFEDHVYSRIIIQWADAVEEFQEILESHSVIIKSSTVLKSMKIPIAIGSSRLQQTDMPPSRSGSTRSDGITPPRILMTYPILASFVNNLLTSFNDLRLCTLQSLRHRLAIALNEILDKMIRSIISFCDTNKLILYSKDEVDINEGMKTTQLITNIRGMAQVIQQEVLPFLIQCYRRLYPDVPSSNTITDTNNTSDSSLCLLGLNEIKLVEIMIAGKLLPEIKEESEKQELRGDISGTETE